MNMMMPIPAVTQSATQSTLNTTMDNKPVQSVQTSKASQPMISASHTLTSHSGSGNAVVPDAMSPRKAQPLYRLAVLNPMEMSKKSFQPIGELASETLIMLPVSANAVKPNTTVIAASQTVTRFSRPANAGKSYIMTTSGANWSPIKAPQLDQAKVSQSSVTASQAWSTPSNMSVLSHLNTNPTDVPTLISQSKLKSKSHNLITTTPVKSGNCPSILSPADNSATACQLTSHHPSGNKVLEIGGHNLPSHNISMAAHQTPLLAKKSVPVPGNVESVTLAPYRLVTLQPQGRSPTIPISLVTPPKREMPGMSNTGVTIQSNTGMPVLMPFAAEPVPRTVGQSSYNQVHKNLMLFHSNMGDPSATLSPQAMEKGSEPRNIQKMKKELKDHFNRGALSESSQSVSSSGGLCSINNPVRVAEPFQTTEWTPAKRKTLHNPCTSPSVAPGTGPAGMVDAGPSTKPPRALETQIENTTILAKKISPQSQPRPCKGDGQQVMSEDVIIPDILVQNTTMESGTLIQGSKKTAEIPDSAVYKALLPSSHQVISEDVTTPDRLVPNTTVGNGTTIEGPKETPEMPDSAVYKASLLSGCSLKISRLEDGNSSFPKRSKRKKSITTQRVLKQGKCHCALRRSRKCKGHRPSQKSTLFSKHGTMEYAGMVPTSESTIQDHMVVDDEHCIQQLISSGRIDYEGRVRNIDHSALQSCESVYSVKIDATLSEGGLDQLSSIDSDITDVALIDAGKEVQPSFVGKMIVDDGISSSTDIQQSVSLSTIDDKGRVRNTDCDTLQRPEAIDSARIGASTSDVENQVQSNYIGKMNLNEGTYCSAHLRLDSLDSVVIDDSLQDLENMLIPVEQRYIGKMIPSEVIPPSVDEDVKEEVESIAVDEEDDFNSLVYLDFAESDNGDPLIHYPSGRNIFDLDKEGATTVIKPNQVVYGEETGYHINRTVNLAPSVIHITTTEPEPPRVIEAETNIPSNADLMAPLQRDAMTKSHNIGPEEWEKLNDSFGKLNKADVIPSEVKSFFLSLMKSMDSLQKTIINLEEAQNLSQQTKPLLHIYDTNRAGWSNVQKVISRHRHVLLQVNQTSSSMLQHLLDQAHHVWLKDVSRNQDKAANMEETSSSELGTNNDKDIKDVGLLIKELVSQDAEGNEEKQKKNSQGTLRQEYSKLKQELHLAACMSLYDKLKTDENKAPEKSKGKSHRKRIPPTSECHVNLSNTNIKSDQENESEDASGTTNTMLDSDEKFTSIKPIANIKNKSKGSRHLSPVKKSSTSKSSSTFLKMYSHKHHRRPGSTKRRSEEVVQILMNGKEHCFQVKGNEVNANSDKFSGNKRQKSSSLSTNEMYIGNSIGNHKKGHNSDGSSYNKPDTFKKQRSKSSNDGHHSQVKRRLSDPEREAPPNKLSCTKSSRKEKCTSIRDVSLMTQKGQPSQQSSSAETKSISVSCISKNSQSEPLIRQISKEKDLRNKCGKQVDVEVSEVKELRSHATETISSTTVAYDLSEEQLVEIYSENEFTVIQANIQGESLDTGVDDRKRIIKELERLGRIQQSLSKRSNEIIKMYENIEDNREKLACEPSKDSPINQNCEQLKDLSEDEKRHRNKESQQKQYNQPDKKNKEHSQGNQYYVEQENNTGKEKEVSERMQSKDKVRKASGIIESQAQRVSEVKSNRDRLTAISNLATNKEDKGKKQDSSLEKKSAQTKKSDHTISKQSITGTQNESPNLASPQKVPDRGNKQKGNGSVHKKRSSHSRTKYEQGKPELQTQKFEKKTVHHKKKPEHVQSGVSKGGLQQESVKKTSCDDYRLYHGKTGASSVGKNPGCADKHNRNIGMTDTKPAAMGDNGSHSKRKKCSDTYFTEKSQRGHDCDQIRKHKRLHPCYQFVNRQEWKGKCSTDTSCTKSGNQPDEAFDNSKGANKVQKTKRVPEIKPSGKRGSPKEVIAAGRRRGLWQREECISIVNAVYNFEPFSEPFRSEVDSSKIPDYYQIVKLPISLDSVASRVRNCHYEDVYHFVSDMRRIFWNCRLYNESGQQFIPHCDEAKKYFEKRLRKAFPKMNFKGVSGEPKILPTQSTQHTSSRASQRPVVEIPLELRNLFN